MSYTTLLKTGASGNRVDIVFLGDGYTAGQLAGDYRGDVQAMITYLFEAGDLTEPFGRYKDYFNIHAIDVASRQSGADVEPEGIVVDTALNAKYYWDGSTERLLYIDDNLADAIVQREFEGTDIAAEMRFVTVNSDRYGGGGGSYGVYAGGNPSAREVAVHEIGHSFAHLADEYDDYDPNAVSTYRGSEPFSANLTKDAGGARWSEWLGYDQPGIGIIGAYEGGAYVDKGIFRPSLDSKMRSLDNPFDVVSQQAFILNFYDYVKPLDGWSHSDAQGPLTGVTELSVDPISDATIGVEWRVNGQMVGGDTLTLDLQSLGLAPGDYQVSARAFDDTGLVRAVDPRTEQTVTWTVRLGASESSVPSEGNDTFSNPVFPSTIDGLGGRDTLRLDGAFADFSIAPVEGGFALTRAGQPDAVLSMAGVEVLAFTDATLELRGGEPATGTYALYQTVFDRTPDLSGLSYWVPRAEAGLPLIDIAGLFTQSSEFTDAYGVDPSDEVLVDRLYANVFGRNAEESGKAFWLNALANGASDADVVLGFSQSTELLAQIDNQVDDGFFIQV